MTTIRMSKNYKYTVTIKGVMIPYRDPALVHGRAKTPKQAYKLADRGMRKMQGNVRNGLVIL